MVKMRDEPCPRCDWRFPGFHICLDLPKKIMQQVEDGYERDSNGEMITDENSPKPRKSRAKDVHISHRDAIAAGVRAAYASNPKRIERDKEIVRLYGKEELSVREVAKKMNLADKTVMSALHRAQDRREVVIRPARRRTKAA
jgi:DNA-directed RNA polymerase specialized sigma24 family protein